MCLCACVCVWVCVSVLLVLKWSFDWGIFQNVVLKPWSKHLQFTRQKPFRLGVWRLREGNRQRWTEKTCKQCRKHTFRIKNYLYLWIPCAPVCSTFCEHVPYSHNSKCSSLFLHPNNCCPNFFYQRDYLEYLRLSSVAMTSLSIF